LRKVYKILACAFFALLCCKANGSVGAHYTVGGWLNTYIELLAYTNLSKPNHCQLSIINYQFLTPFGAPIAALNLSTVSNSPNRYLREGKEYIDDFWWNKYDYGWRTFDSWRIGSLQVDPMAHLFPWMSPYALWGNNPQKYTDPTGMSLWKPEIDDFGNTQYIAEQGDNINTFVSQYDISRSDAENIFNQNNIDTKADNVEGQEISGQIVETVTGNDVLKLDMKSKMATQQRVLDHLVFALDYSRKEDFIMDAKDYFNPNQNIKGTGNINVDGIAIPVNYDASFAWGSKSWSFPTRIDNTINNSNGIMTNTITFTRPTSGGHYIPSIMLKVPSQYRNTIFDRLKKKYF
jgi:hypothetical protein